MRRDRDKRGGEGVRGGEEGVAGFVLCGKKQEDNRNDTITWRNTHLTAFIYLLPAPQQYLFCLSVATF